MRRFSLALRITYAVCLLCATATHVMTHVRFGVLLGRLPSDAYPVFTRMYWSSLTLLDPISALLLFMRPRWGVLLTACIIVSDVAHNTWLLHRFGAHGDFMYWCQVGFLILVAATAKTVWTGSEIRVSPAT